MAQHHNYSITEIENMIPWEREIYVALLMKFLEEEKQKYEEQERRAKQRG